MTYDTSDHIIDVAMYRKILGKKHTGQKIYKCFGLGRSLSSQSREPEKTRDIAQNYISYQAGWEKKTSKKPHVYPQ